MKNGIESESNEVLNIEHCILLKRIATELSIMQDYAAEIQNIFSNVIQLSDLDTTASMKLQSLDLLSQSLDDIVSLMVCISADRYNNVHNQQKIVSVIKLTDLRQRLVSTDFFGQSKNSESGDLTLL